MTSARRRATSDGGRPSTSTSAALSDPPRSVGATSHTAVSPKRLQAREDGIRAEHAAARHLIASGLVILGRNVRVGRYEIDLLAHDGPVVVVVEVRARREGALVRALDTIGARKRARLRRAAAWLWRDRFAKDQRFERLRFDCVGVTFDNAGRPVVEHIRAAF